MRKVKTKTWAKGAYYDLHREHVLEQRVKAWKFRVKSPEEQAADLKLGEILEGLKWLPRRGYWCVLPNEVPNEIVRMFRDRRCLVRSIGAWTYHITMRGQLRKRKR